MPHRGPCLVPVRIPARLAPIPFGPGNWASRAARYPTGAIAVLAVVLAMAACGEVRINYGDSHCPSRSPPGVVVEFVARSNGSPVAVGATGVLRDGPYVEQMIPTDSRQALPGRTYALAGGHDREGIYDVRVETSFGEVLTWSRIKVSADRCGPFTVVLQASLTAF